MTGAYPAEHWRALDAPFTPQPDWQPIPGRCSRCGGKAWRGQTRWWHDGAACPSRGRTAHFAPD